MDNSPKATPDKKFTPVVPAGQSIAEVTWKAIILGIIISVVFGVANAYIGLKFGMTVSASIPAAVISMAVLRSLFRKQKVNIINKIKGVCYLCLKVY